MNIAQDQDTFVIDITSMPFAFSIYRKEPLQVLLVRLNIRGFYICILSKFKSNSCFILKTDLTEQPTEE